MGLNWGFVQVAVEAPRGQRVPAFRRRKARDAEARIVLARL